MKWWREWAQSIFGALNGIREALQELNQTMSNIHYDLRNK